MAFGDQINPALINVDWSPIERGGQAKAAAIQSAGQSIEGAVSAYADYKKEQKEKEKTIKQSELYIDAAMKLFPEMTPSLQRAKMEIDDKNIPLDDRFATAESVQGLLNMGMERMKMNNEIVESSMANDAKMAGLRNSPVQFEELPQSDGSKVKVAIRNGQIINPSELIPQGGSIPGAGGVPQLPADMQDEINTTMQDDMNGEVLPGRPIEGQIQELVGMTENGNIRLVANGEEIETDKATFTQKLIGDMTEAGTDPTTAAADAAQILSALELKKEKAAQKPVLGLSPPDAQKMPPTEMTVEQVDELTRKGMRVKATPTGKGTFLVEETTSSPETQGQQYSEPYVDPSTGQYVQKKSNGELKILRETADERMLSAIQVARDKYNKGDVNGALDLLASVRIKGPFGGYPTVDDLEEIFGMTTPQTVEPNLPANPQTPQAPLEDRLRKALGQ